MSLQPRVAALVVLGLLLAVSARAQTPAGNATNKARPNKPVATRNAADPLAESRRANAISLLSSLADEARGFHDEALRARVQARAADALWETDKERARALFRRAWDAAEVADRDAERKDKEEQERQRRASGGGAFVWNNQPRLRPEVLRLAAKRERALGEEFLAKLDEARKQEAEAATATPPDAPAATDSTRPNQLSEALAQRLDLARQLLQTGDVEQAKQFAQPALGRVTIPALQFLLALRAPAPNDADQIYRDLLTRAATDPASDANTISHLSSYLFSPTIFVTIDRRGSWNSQGWPPPATTAEIPADLRTAFFNVAAAVLLRPLPPPDQDRTSSGRVGTYAIIARLLPVFEQYGSDKVQLLRTQLAALSPDAPENWRTGRESMLTEGLRTAEDQERDRVQEALDRLKTASTQDARDEVYVAAAFAAQRKGDLARARDLADKISDQDARRQLRAYLDYVGVMRASEKKDVAELLRLAADGDLTHVQRVYAYTQAARLLRKDDRPRAIETLDAAAQEARRIDAADPDRARAMLSVLSELYELDHGRAWEQLPDLVKIVNALDNFTGEDGQLVGQFRAKGWGSINSTSSDSFDLAGIFSKLAREDMDRAVEFARSFTGEAPRAAAMLAVARAVLEKKS